MINYVITFVTTILLNSQKNAYNFCYACNLTRLLPVVASERSAARWWSCMQAPVSSSSVHYVIILLRYNVMSPITDDQYHVIIFSKWTGNKDRHYVEINNRRKEFIVFPILTFAIIRQHANDRRNNVVRACRNREYLMRTYQRLSIRLGENWQLPLERLSLFSISLTGP